MKIKGILKKINWKILNFAFYFEIIMLYFLPFKVVDEYKYKIGFPFPFITIYEKPIIHVNPYLSIHLNQLSLILNLVIIYFVTALLIKFYRKIK